MSKHPDEKLHDAHHTIHELRQEIIRLETEVGQLCEKVQAQENELKLLRKG